MGLESATYISQLDASNPLGSDPKSQGDDHLRLIKAAIKATFPAFGAAALASSNLQIDKIIGVINVNSGAPGGSQFIDASGNTGFGAAPAYARVDVVPNSGQIGIAVRAPSTQIGSMEISGNNLVPGVTSLSIAHRATAVAAIVNRSNANLVLGANSLDHCTITPAGEFGVGTTTPGTQGKLAVVAGSFNFFANPGEGGNTTAFGSRNGPLSIVVNGTRIAGGSNTGVFDYNGREVGYRDLPVAPTSTALERGTCTALSAGITLDTTPAAGSIYSAYNDTAGTLTITQGAGLTLVWAGTMLTGNRTLSIRGFFTVWYRSSTVAVISGSGLS